MTADSETDLLPTDHEIDAAFNTILQVVVTRRLRANQASEDSALNKKVALVVRAAKEIQETPITSVGAYRVRAKDIRAAEILDELQAIFDGLLRGAKLRRSQGENRTSARPPPLIVEGLPFLPGDFEISTETLSVTLAGPLMSASLAKTEAEVLRALEMAMKSKSNTPGEPGSVLEMVRNAEGPKGAALLLLDCLAGLKKDTISAALEFLDAREDAEWETQIRGSQLLDYVLCRLGAHLGDCEHLSRLIVIT